MKFVFSITIYWAFSFVLICLNVRPRRLEASFARRRPHIQAQGYPCGIRDGHSGSGAGSLSIIISLMIDTDLSPPLRVGHPLGLNLTSRVRILTAVFLAHAILTAAVTTFQNLTFLHVTVVYCGRGVKLTTHLHLMPRSKNAWSYTSTPQYVFMAWCLVKHREIFTFTFTTVTGRD
jgi:hypothetical protein